MQRFMLLTAVAATLATALTAAACDRYPSYGYGNYGYRPYPTGYNYRYAGQGYAWPRQVAVPPVIVHDGVVPLRRPPLRPFAKVQPGFQGQPFPGQPAFQGQPGFQGQPLAGQPGQPFQGPANQLPQKAIVAKKTTPALPGPLPLPPEEIPAAVGPQASTAIVPEGPLPPNGDALSAPAPVAPTTGPTLTPPTNPMTQTVVPQNTNPAPVNEPAVVIDSNN